ncbi:MAG: 3-hydroxyacyl-ACP dehydratase FabZ [Caulobacteraceae bacterium]
MTQDQSELAPGEDIGFAEVLRRIPHRYPMLMVDRAEHYVAGKSITGIKCVTMNEPQFMGHFPNNPVMPGVLIVEAMGQTGAVMMSKTLNADVTGKTIFFTSIGNAKFRSPVRPGDVMRMPVIVIRQRGDLFKFQGKTYVGDRLVAEADFTAMVVENG